MNLQRMIVECSERLEYYEANPTERNAALYVECTANRLDALLKLQFQNEKENFYP